MKLGRLLVAEKRVRDPDACPAVVAEPQLRRSADARREDKARVAPRLTQVHTHRVVLYTRSRYYYWTTCPLYRHRPAGHRSEDSPRTVQYVSISSWFSAVD